LEFQPLGWRSRGTHDPTGFALPFRRDGEGVVATQFTPEHMQSAVFARHEQN